MPLFPFAFFIHGHSGVRIRLVESVDLRAVCGRPCGSLVIHPIVCLTARKNAPSHLLSPPFTYAGGGGGKGWRYGEGDEGGGYFTTFFFFLSFFSSRFCFHFSVRALRVSACWPECRTLDSLAECCCFGSVAVRRCESRAMLPLLLKERVMYFFFFSNEIGIHQL